MATDLRGDFVDSEAPTPPATGGSALSSADILFSTGGSIPVPIVGIIPTGFTGLIQRVRSGITYFVLRQDGETLPITTTSLTDPLNNIIL